MSISLATFERLRPWLYHLTARENRTPIEKTRRLLPACALLADPPELLELRRPERVRTARGLVCDQVPLFENKMKLEAGYTFQAFVKLLNQHVFFWPGTDAGPEKAGMNHFERYRSTEPVILRVRSGRVLQQYAD
jgi:hypothetical protein